MLIKLLYSCFVSFLDLYKEYNNCLISFLSFSELFPAFNWAKVIGNLLSIWFGVSFFNPCPCWFPFSAADFSVSKSGMSVVPISSLSSVDSSSDSFSTLNPSLYGKIPFLNALIMLSLLKRNFFADFKAFSFSFIFIWFFGLQLLFSLYF